MILPHNFLLQIGVGHSQTQRLSAVSVPVKLFPKETCDKGGYSKSIIVNSTEEESDLRNLEKPQGAAESSY